MRRLCAIVVLAALAAPLASAATWVYPSASSAVVGSLGFIDADEIGYFWDASRGDSVTETFPDVLPSVNKLELKLNVPTNVLGTGQQVNWNVLLNNTVVGSFSVIAGFTGNINQTYNFAPIAAPGNYTVRMAVTNVVPVGLGSHTLAYAGEFQHSVTLTPEPSSLALLALSVLGLRRR